MRLIIRPLPLQSTLPFSLLTHPIILTSTCPHMSPYSTTPYVSTLYSACRYEPCSYPGLGKKEKIACQKQRPSFNNGTLCVMTSALSEVLCPFINHSAHHSTTASLSVMTSALSEVLRPFINHSIHHSTTASLSAMTFPHIYSVRNKESDHYYVSPSTYTPLDVCILV